MRVSAPAAFLAALALGSTVSTGVRATAPAQTTPPAKIAAKTPNTPDFVKDIQPIFQSRCTTCHGADEQKNQLRLDSYTGAVRGGMSGKVIVPGHSGDSLLVQHISGTLEPRMPFEKPPLPDDEIARIAAWIDAGASGPSKDGNAEVTHWAYVKPKRPEPPTVTNAAWVRNPIDRFVLARLEKEGLSPSPEASKEILIRRVTLDLTGLPPTLAEMDAFLANDSPDAYEKVVDRLLASPHYGERWARPWLDLARYADTNGYEKDRRRVAWKYRDWVIDAFNKDMPFNQFTIEQIAGDMLKGATIDQKIATGFHRNTLLNQEGGIDVEEARWETLVDRVNTTASVWLGSTLNCAQCHNHKYDPFSQKDYYRMLAFFDNVDYRIQGKGEVVMDKWIVEPDLELTTPVLAEKRAALRAEAERLESDVQARNLDIELEKYERAIAGPAPRWIPLEPIRYSAKSGATLKRQPDGSLLVSGKPADGDTYSITVRAPLDGTTALKLEALPDASLPGNGPGRGNYGAFVLTGFAAKAAKRSIAFAGAGADLNDGGTAALAIDGQADTGWGVTGESDAARPHFIIFNLRRPLIGSATPSSSTGSPVRPASTITVTLDFERGWPYLQSSLGRFRMLATTAANPWGGLPVPDTITPILRTARNSRTDQQKKGLLSWFRPLAASLDRPRDRIRQIEREMTDMNVVTAPVMQERATFERPSTPLRKRGSYMSPGERLYAATPAFLPPLRDTLPANRLGLAYWLVDEDNPLTARVTVNRFWEQLFGRGLVLTSEDFGTQGEPPTHPDLLDWLATDFVRQNWSMKAIHRLMVTSATYRQSSRVTPALLERDPDNRLLARGPRFRVEAEIVRDLSLAVSGLLSSKLGGPSVFPEQPDGIWDIPYNDDRWVQSEEEDKYRRSLYTFIRRTAPYPMLTTFDAPSREFCTVRRVRTDTPLQALTTLNDPAFFAAARALADRALHEAGPEPESRASYAFRLCTGRRPSPDEIAPLLRFYRDQSTRFIADRAAAESVAGSFGDLVESHSANGHSDVVTLAERAAWTMVANVVLNLDETLTKE